MKFIRGHSAQSSTSSKLSTSSTSECSSTETCSNQSEPIKHVLPLNLNDLKANRLLLEVKLNTVLHHKLLAKLSKKKKKSDIIFHKEASSLNSSCNDSVISDSTVSRCTSSCGERSSVSELELSCSSTSSDSEEANKFAANKSAAKIEIDKKESNKNDQQVIKAELSPSQSFKVESKRKSILLSNQVTKNRSISTTARKLLLPKDVPDSYECCLKPKTSNLMVKFFTYSLRDDVEYKTLSISNNTTSKQVIHILLDKFKMKHRDSNLFYLNMEIVIRKNGIPIRSSIRLNNEACPAQLKACYPNDEIRFLIENKPGGLLRVYDSCLLTSSLYKGILIDTTTTVDELIQLMLNCYHSKDKASNYSLFVVDKLGSYKLDGSELPLVVQEDWNEENNPIFQLRKTKEIDCNYLNRVFLIKRFTGHSINNISSIIYQDHFYI